MKPRTVLLLALPGVVFLGVLAANLGLLESRQVRAEPAPRPDPAAPLERLAEAVRIETVSRDGQGPGEEALAALHAWLARSYPRVHATLERESTARLPAFQKYAQPQAPQEQQQEQNLGVDCEANRRNGT